MPKGRKFKNTSWVMTCVQNMMVSTQPRVSAPILNVTAAATRETGVHRNSFPYCGLLKKCRSPGLLCMTIKL